MKIKLVNNDRDEVVENFPIHRFHDGNNLEKRRFTKDNSYWKTEITELRTRHFCMSDSRIQCHRDCKLLSETDNNNVFWLCAVLGGNNFRGCHPSGRDEECWLVGHANLLSHRNIRMHDLYKRNKSLRAAHIMLSTQYMERVAEWYPHLFENMVNRFLNNESFRLFPENVLFCPEIKRTLNNMFHYNTAGNAAALYLDAKILEVLSLLVCQSSQRDCSACASYSEKDNDKLFHAKAIIEQQYRNPPSLHELALMVGTNICKLKTGFKILFGTTVFEYLFDFRMELACKYLSDTGKPVQEIAEYVGYEYHSHFSTAFKRKFGLSPLEYRNAGLNKP